MRPINPFRAPVYANIIAACRSLNNRLLYSYDPLPRAARSELQLLIAARGSSDAPRTEKIDRAIVALLDLYVAQRQAVLTPGDVNEWRFLSPAVLAVLMYAKDGSCQLYSGPYDLMVDWVASKGVLVLCERLPSDLCRITYDHGEYVLTARNDSEIGRYPTLDAARDAYAAEHPEG